MYFRCIIKTYILDTYLNLKNSDFKDDFTLITIFSNT